MTPRTFLLLPLVSVMVACQTTPKEEADVPLTLQTFPATYSDRVVEIADLNKDGEVSMVEWINAGGDRRSFLLADQNKDGVVTRSELIRISDNARFMDFTRRYADFNRDNLLTAREFRSASGTQVLRFEF